MKKEIIGIGILIIAILQFFTVLGIKIEYVFSNEPITDFTKTSDFLYNLPYSLGGVIIGLSFCLFFFGGLWGLFIALGGYDKDTDSDNT